MKIAREYGFSEKANNDFGVYGYSKYFGSHMYISKSTNKVYQVSACTDIMCVIMDVGDVYKANEIIDDLAYVLPISVWVWDSCSDTEMVDTIATEVNQYESDPLGYFEKQIEYMRKEI